MLRKTFLLSGFFTALLSSALSQSEQYPIFDGQYYNGLYYPRVNIIEWDQPNALIFNIYSKDKPVDISGRVIKRGHQKIFEFAYDLPFRNERLCRSVLAPESFNLGQELHFYIDKNDHEMNQIYVSQKSLKKPVYSAKAFSPCNKHTAEVKIPVVSQPPEEAKKTPKKKRIPASKETPVWYDDKPRDSKQFDLFNSPPPQNPEDLPKNSIDKYFQITN